jgi:hypothetical protein
VTDKAMSPLRRRMIEPVAPPQSGSYSDHRFRIDRRAPPWTSNDALVHHETRTDRASAHFPRTSGCPALPATYYSAAAG